ncbi:MAG: hypothetical protein AB7G11_08095 [Phycisphaerales bacterium]
MSPETLQPAQSLLESLRSLPWAAHLIAVAALVSGLMLWLYGRRLLRPMIVIVFALTGAGSGFVLAPLWGVMSSPIGMIVGGVLGAAAGVVLYRFAMAVSVGLILAVLAPVLCVAIVDAPERHERSTGVLSRDELRLRGVPEGPAEPRSVTGELMMRGEQLRNSMQDALVKSAAAPDVDHSAPAEAPSATQRAKAFALALADEIRAQWHELPARVRVMLMGSASLGLGLGIFLGLLMPKWTSGGVTAMLGAAIWLPAATWLIAAAGVPLTERFSIGAVQWVVVWGVASLVGALLQWRGIKSTKRTPATVIIQPAA